jgi:hypothetical protein
MNELEFNYNLPITLLGGQDFNWEPVDDEYFASTQEAIIRIKLYRLVFYGKPTLRKIIIN